MDTDRQEALLQDRELMSNDNNGPGEASSTCLIIEEQKNADIEMVEILSEDNRREKKITVIDNHYVDESDEDITQEHQRQRTTSQLQFYKAQLQQSRLRKESANGSLMLREQDDRSRRCTTPMQAESAMEENRTCITPIQAESALTHYIQTR